MFKKTKTIMILAVLLTTTFAISKEVETWKSEKCSKNPDGGGHNLTGRKKVTMRVPTTRIGCTKVLYGKDCSHCLSTKTVEILFEGNCEGMEGCHTH